MNSRSLFYHTACPALLLLLLCLQIRAQDLVPNPSFEDVNTCGEFSQPCSPSAWFYLSRKFTTGYYPRFPSATGSRHLQIVAASRETVNRQYWETMLLCPLQAGEHYTVSLKVASPAGISPEGKGQLARTCPNLRDIGIWFTNRFVFVQGDSILQPRTYLSFTGVTPKDLKNGWFELKKEFVPTSNSTILIVGNFARGANADIMDQRNATTPTIDVLVDDLAIVNMKGTTCPGYQKIKDSLYAIIRRHSDVDPNHPDIIDTTTDNQTQDHSTDSSKRRPNNPVNDPLFGPEPRRTTDTPKLSHPPAPDTIIIHNIQFDFDKYLVQNPDTLQRYQRLLTRPGVKKIQVVGFTDDAGSDTYNLDLSQKRANEVARLLSSKFNIPPAIIQAEGRGISRKYPTKYLNRRVEIYIFHE